MYKSLYAQKFLIFFDMARVLIYFDNLE